MLLTINYTMTIVTVMYSLRQYY